MKSSATHLLLIESDPADAKVIKDALHDDSAAFVVEWVKSLAEALEYLANNPIEVVLLDLALPDGKGLGAFDKVIVAAPDALILPVCIAAAQSVAPSASANQVSASISMTLGGVPRVCVGPWPHCTAA